MGFCSVLLGMILLLTVLGSKASDAAELESAMSFVQDCELALDVQKKIATGQTPNDLEYMRSSFCVAYIEGFVNGIRIGTNDHDKDSKLCPDKISQYSNDQWTRIVVNAGKQHPDQLSKPKIQFMMTVYYTEALCAN